MAKGDFDDELISTGRKKKNKEPKKKKEKKKRKAENLSASSKDGVKVDFRVTEKPRNKYYLAAAGKYRAARYISVVILAIFLFVMLLFFRESITYSNLMYLVRDLDSDSDSTVGAYANITYDGQYSKEFELFKGRIAVGGTTELKLYDPSGSKEAEYDLAYSNPRLVTGDKYAIMYDAGDRAYSVYTTVARVLSEETDEIIEDAAVSDSGYYALLTHSKESKFLVTVYNSSFRPVTKYYKDKYVIDVALNQNGDEAAIVSAATGGAAVSCEVSLCKVGTEESNSLIYEGLMPISAKYADDGTLFVMCDTSLLIFRGGELIQKHDFTAETPCAFAIDGNIAAVALRKNAIGSENDVLVFDINGNVLYNITLEHKVSFAATDAKYAVYAVGDGEATKIDLKDGSLSRETVSVTPVKILAPEGSLLVCGENGTASYFFE